MHPFKKYFKEGGDETSPTSFQFQFYYAICLISTEAVIPVWCP